MQQADFEALNEAAKAAAMEWPTDLVPVSEMLSAIAAGSLGCSPAVLIAPNASTTRSRYAPMSGSARPRCGERPPIGLRPSRRGRCGGAGTVRCGVEGGGGARRGRHSGGGTVVDGVLEGFFALLGLLSSATLYEPKSGLRRRFGTPSTVLKSRRRRLSNGVGPVGRLGGFNFARFRVIRARFHCRGDQLVNDSG